MINVGFPYGTNPLIHNFFVEKDVGINHRIVKCIMKKAMLKTLDLFSGIGGFSLGLERTGQFKTVAFCEIDKYCKLLLQKHWKGVKIYDDVKKITKERLEADGIESPDVITGGVPCQPFSVAGKQKGTSDDRHLWPEMFRIIKAFKSRFVIVENVRGLINIQDGVVFEAVCTDLESEGYEVQPFIIPAAGVGAPHRRERVWIIATNSSELGCRSGSDNWKRRQIQNDEERNVKKDQPKQQRWESRSREESNTRSITESRTNQRNEFRRQDLSGSKNVADTECERTKRSEEDRSLFENRGDEILTDRLQTSKTTYVGGNSDSGRETKEDENVADTENGRRQQTQSERREGIERGSIDSRGIEGERKDIGTNVANTNTRLGNGENQEIQTGRNTSNISSEKLANTDSERLEGFRKSGRELSQKFFATDSSEGQQGAMDQGWWSVEPDVGRVAHGVQGRVHRLKGLGNAIVPQIAEEIGRAIIKAMK